MASVYSLVCWGGRTGKTVTLTVASPCVVTSTSHGLRDGTGLRFASNGDTLPTGLTAGVTYYTKPTGAGTFNLYSDASLTTIINTSGSESGTHILQSLLVADPSNALTSYGLSDLSRWGSSGSERIYDSLYSCNADRYGQSFGNNSEVYEIGEAFEDICSSSVAIGSFSVNNGQAASYTVTTKIAGVRTPAYHNGVPYSAYMLSNTHTSATLEVKVGDVTVEGINILNRSTTTGTLKYCVSAVTASSYNVTFSKIIASAGNAGNDYYGSGFNLNVNSIFVDNCVAHGFIAGTTTYGFFLGTSVGPNCRLQNCLATKNYNGIYHSNRTLCIYNCMAVGNTRNWRKGVAHSSGQINRCYGNLGDETDTRVVTFTPGGTTMTFAQALEVTPVKDMSFILKTTGTLPTVSGGSLQADTMYFFAGSPTTTSTTVWWYAGGASAYTFLDAGTGVHTAIFVPTSRNNLGVGVAIPGFTAAPGNTFVDWSSNDFRPSSASLAIDGAFDFYLSTTSDIADNERPSYAGGAAEYFDVGAYEYDKGYGNHPASTTVTFAGVNAGSEIRVYDSTGAELDGIESCDVNQVLSWAIPEITTVTARIVHPDYKIKEFNFTTSAGAVNLPVQQEVDKWYSNP